MRLVGVGFESSGLAVTEHDLCRVVRHGEALFVLLADASGAPFERVTPALSCAILDRVEAATPSGVNAAIDAARAAVEELHDPEAEGWILIANVGVQQIAMRWVGLAEAWLLCGDQVIEHARGHSARYQGIGLPGDLSLRGLGATWNGYDAAMWKRPPGARLVCANPSVARMPSGDLPRLATAGDPETAARALVAATIARDPDRHALAVVVEL